MAAVQILQVFGQTKRGILDPPLFLKGKVYLYLDSNSLYVYDEDGNEKKMTILFIFDSDETGCQYVVSRSRQ